LIFVVAFLILLFVFILPAISGGRNNRGYSNHGYNTVRGGQWRHDYRDDARQWRSGPSQDYGPRHDSRPQGGGCRSIVIVVVLVVLAFAAGVIYWSIAVQAGGGLF